MHTEYSESMYFIKWVLRKQIHYIPKPPARTGSKLNKSHPRGIRTPRVCTTGDSTAPTYRVTSSTCVRSCLVSSCQRACYLPPGTEPSCGMRCVTALASNAFQAGVCGGEEKRKQKEIAVLVSVKLVRGRRPLCCTYTCSTARTVWPAAGTETLPARAGRTQQRCQWPGNAHTRGSRSSLDKTSRTQNFNLKL